MINNNYDTGWIKIHRQIKEHWIWDDPIYLKAWLGILLTVNHEDKKILIQGELIECKRGQSILSLAGWVKCFGKKWTMQRIRTFFELLKRDQMIITEGLRKTTRLTVCNYNNYQFEQQAKNKQRTNRQHPDNILTTTNKNEEELIKNENNNNPTWRDMFDVYLKECKEGYGKFMENPELIKKEQRLNPGVNIKLTIEKGFQRFWGTEEGWLNKKGKRIKDINWERTISNSIDQKMNKVYYTKQELALQC